MGAAYTAACSTLTYTEAYQRYCSGTISDDVWRWYKFFWTWCCPRFSVARQDRVWERLGRAAYYRRFDRVRRLRDRIIASR